MSSVTRFIRQVQTPYFSTASFSANHIYEFQPSGTNVVGNYPPGIMALASNSLKALIAAVGAGNGVLRDMGKTVQAPIGSLTGNVGFFRQVQLLAPTAVTAAQGYAGGVAGNTFGVGGVATDGADAYNHYLTFYVPVTVAGVNADLSSSVDMNASGQM
jgi:hypothetical protein